MNIYIFLNFKYSFLFLNHLRIKANPMLAATATKLITIPSIEAHFSVTPGLIKSEGIPKNLDLIRVLNPSRNRVLGSVADILGGLGGWLGKYRRIRRKITKDIPPWIKRRMSISSLASFRSDSLFKQRILSELGGSSSQSSEASLTIKVPKIKETPTPRALNI